MWPRYRVLSLVSSQARQGFHLLTAAQEGYCQHDHHLGFAYNWIGRTSAMGEQPGMGDHTLVVPVPGLSNGGAGVRFLEHQSHGKVRNDD